MTISQTLYSSRSEEWPTPKTFFDQLKQEFPFSLDPCATRERLGNVDAEKRNYHCADRRNDCDHNVGHIARIFQADE